MAQLIIAGVTAFAIGVAYRYAWDDPSEAFANYMRSGVHGMGLAASGLGAHLYFNSRLSGRLRRWPLLAEIALRAVVMAIAVSATAAGLQVALYDRRAEGTWYFSELPRIVAITFALSIPRAPLTQRQHRSPNRLSERFEVVTGSFFSLESQGTTGDLPGVGAPFVAPTPPRTAARTSRSMLNPC